MREKNLPLGVMRVGVRRRRLRARRIERDQWKVFFKLTGTARAQQFLYLALDRQVKTCQKDAREKRTNSVLAFSLSKVIEKNREDTTAEFSAKTKSYLPVKIQTVFSSSCV